MIIKGENSVTVEACENKDCEYSYKEWVFDGAWCCSKSVCNSEFAKNCEIRMTPFGEYFNKEEYYPILGPLED